MQSTQISQHRLLGEPEQLLDGNTVAVDSLNAQVFPSRCLRYSSPMKEQTGKAGKPPVDQGNPAKRTTAGIPFFFYKFNAGNKKHPNKLSQILIPPPYHKYPLNSPDIRHLRRPRPRARTPCGQRFIVPRTKFPILLWDFHGLPSKPC